jgi:hypothetical protein
MKRIVLLLALVLVFPLYGDDGKPSKPEEKPAASTAATPAPEAETDTETETSAASVKAEDSPLVAAAKKSAAKGDKSKHKITNANLKSVGTKARITTTTHQHPVSSSAPPRPRKAIQITTQSEPDHEKAPKDVKTTLTEQREAIPEAVEESEEGLYDPGQFDENGDPVEEPADPPQG